MAVDMFLKLEGIKGESKDAKHPDEIQVLAWSWGVSNSGSHGHGGGGGSGKANANDISFTKNVDRASAATWMACTTGKHIKDATLVVRKAGDKPLEYLKITMTDLLVSSISTGGSGGETQLTENVSLNFAKIKMEYFEQDAKGAGKPAGEMGYDFQKNVKL